MQPDPVPLIKAYFDLDGCFRGIEIPPTNADTEILVTPVAERLYSELSAYYPPLENDLVADSVEARKAAHG